MSNRVVTFTCSCCVWYVLRKHAHLACQRYHNVCILIVVNSLRPDMPFCPSVRRWLATFPHLLDVRAIAEYRLLFTWILLIMSAETFVNQEYLYCVDHEGSKHSFVMNAINSLRSFPRDFFNICFNISSCVRLSPEWIIRLNLWICVYINYIEI